MPDKFKYPPPKLSRRCDSTALIEESAAELDEIILLGKERWELLLYSLLSGYAPKIPVGGILKRQTLHIMLCGDLSSGKTSVLHLLEHLSPKSEWLDDATMASFIGISTRSGIKPGVIDRVQDSVLLIPEYRNVKIPYLRQFLDNDKIKIYKWGIPKVIVPNTTLIAGINPKTDWFVDQLGLRGQVNQSEGDISRFDVFLMLTVSVEKNAKIADGMPIFDSSRAADLGGMKMGLLTLARRMKGIRKVILAEDQKGELKDAFKFHNRRLEGSRPVLLTLRDFEILLRLANVVVCSNGEVDGESVRAKDEDIRKAVSMFEVLIDQRRILYTAMERKQIDLSLKEKLYLKLRGMGVESVRATELEEEIVGNLGMMSRASMYRHLKELIAEGRIEKLANKPMIVSISQNLNGGR